MNVSFSVAMMLQSVNNMGPGIQGAQRMINSLGQSIKNVSKQSSGLNPVQGWEDKVRRVTQQLKEMQKQTEKMKETGSKIRNDGFEKAATGVAISAPLMHMVDKASDRQVSQLVLKEAGMSMGDVVSITGKAKELSTELMFGVNELMAIPLAMQRAGMNAEKIKNSFQQVSYLTELEHLRTKRDSYGISKDLSSMAELAQVTGDQNQLATFFDTVNRIATVTHADVGTLAESTKYFMPVAKMYGMNENDAMMAQGIMSRFGIQGSMAGTHLKDFVDRLNPYEFLKASGRSQQLTAMEEMGFLSGAQYKTLKTGGKKFTDVGESAFFADGKVKGVLDIANVLGKKYAEVMAGDPLHGAQKFAAAMKHIFGEQGKDVAILFAQNPHMIQQMQADLAKVQAIDQSIKDFQSTFRQTFAAFLTNLENIGVEAVTQLMHDLTDGMKTIAPYVDSIAKWAESHKSLVNSIVRATVAVSAFLIVLGTLGIIGGTALKLIAGGLSMILNPFKWALQFILFLAGGFGNLAAGFSLLRQTGAGFWSSLWKGAQLAWPWLNKLSGQIWAFAGQWIVAAARIGAGWLIAMGPVGWVILGITAIIAAAVLAWNSNFMGFRDKCTAAWSWIKDYAEYILPGITQSINDFIVSAKDKWNLFASYTGECWDKIKDQAKPALEYVDSIIQLFTGNWIKYFGGVGEAAKNMLMGIWDAQIGVQIMEGAKMHFANFDKWRASKDQAVDQSFVGGSRNTNTVTQHVNVHVPTTNDANQFVANLQPPIPGKYKNDGYNPPSFSF